MPLFETAGLTLHYTTRFPDAMKRLMGVYSTEERCDVQPVLSLDPTQWLNAILNETEQGEEMVEFYALSAALGEQLPRLGRLQTHGVAIAYSGRAYIFSAPSGTGKSARAAQWQHFLGHDQVDIINGDKPILWFKDGAVLACGSPWAGKEGLQKKVCLPLGGICLLRRSARNVVHRADAKEFFDAYASQVQMPNDPQGQLAALALLDQLYAQVPIFVLENDLSEQGVKVAYERLTGKEYHRHTND